MKRRNAFTTSKREKRNVPVIKPPKPKFIEGIYNKNTSFTETELKRLICIKDYIFKKIRSDYIYQINFTKNSLLQQIYANSFCSLNLYSITFPPSLSIIMPESFKGCHFLNEINFISNDANSNILEICNDAFNDTMIETIIIPKNTKKICSACFPKTLSQIEFENGSPKLEKIGHKAFSQTQLESFKFPLHYEIFVFPKNIFFQCKKLKTLIFDFYTNKNDKIQQENEDNLFEKEKRTNKRYKFNKNLSKLDNFYKNIDGSQNFSKRDIISQSIEKSKFYKDIERSQDFAKSNLISQTKVEKIEVYSSNLNYFYFFNTTKLTSITIREGKNSRYVKIKGCIYTKDKKNLIVAERNIKSATVSSSSQMIANYAFNIKSLEKVNFEKNSKLKEISFFAFSESKIKKLDIPDSVDLIDYCAFYKCNKLETINIPRSINLIDFLTFSFTNLTEILIPKKVIKISFGSFLKCHNLTTVIFELESNLVEIDDLAFSSTKIKSISIPKSVKRIGNYSFLNCKYLETVTFDDKSEIFTIGNQCFYGTKIDESQLNEIYQKVGYFYENLNSDIYFIKTFNKDSLTSVKFPNNINIIDRNAFKDCINLTKVEMNQYITKIMDGAFSNCSSLINLEIPNKVDYFGQMCFRNCLKYEGKIHISNQRKIFVGTSAFENSGLVSFHSESCSIIVEKSAFENCKNFVEFKANANIESIFGSSVFKDCKKMQIAFISPNAEKVSFGKCCFMNTAIQKFIIPINLEDLPHCIFKNCLKLKEVQIDENISSIKSIRSNAFKSSGIKTIYIPSTICIIEDKSFGHCQKLNSVHFARNKFLLKIKFSCFENCSNLKEVIMPEKMNITEIDENVFKGCSIESISFPKSIKLIHKHAFLQCEKLKSITFLGECTIEAYAFLGCKNLQSIKSKSILKVYITFSDYPSIILSTVDFKIFYFNIHKEVINKDMINSLFINEKPTFHSYKLLNYKHSLIFNEGFSFGDDFDYKYNNAYTLCQNIDGGYYMNSKESIYFVNNSINSLSIVKETRFIERSAFEFSNLKKIDFQSGSKLEKIYEFSFKNLEIEEISLPDSLISIGKQAFYNCKMLKKVNISPESKLKIIESNAFEKCGIESFVFPLTLEKIDEFAFFEYFKLKKIENYSKVIEFCYKSFCRSGIENIKFPSKSIFSDSSFKECASLKEIVFDGGTHEVIFGPESFAFTGLEAFEIDGNFDIKENAFIFCKNLKKVFIRGVNFEIDKSSFDFCFNIEEFTFIKKINIDYDIKDIYNNAYFKNIIENVSYSSVKKFLFKIILQEEDNQEKELKVFLENNCFVYNNKLVGVNLTNNEENEIIKVPSCIEKLDFSLFNYNFSIHQIKQIIWSENCIVNDLGPPGFFSYGNLVEITIPKLVQKIPPHLFEHCHFMKIINFENGSILKEIGEFAFSDTSIEKVILPETVLVIKKSAFSYNPKLKEVSFQGEIIESEAFLQTGLTEFILSNNTKKIGEGAFQFCRCLKKFEIDIERSILSELAPFSLYETSIISINIPPEVEIIQNSVFNGCKYLKKVNISNKSKLTEIGEYSFSGNLSLETINIPNSISKLSFNAFINTPSLVKIMNQSNTHFIIKSNNEVYMRDNSLVFVPRNLREFKVKSNCSVIHSGSFCGSNLKKVSFVDNSLEFIEESGFAHSTSLTSITLPKSIKEIGNDAFIGCTNLETVIFDLNCLLKRIPKYCFAFSGLKSIILPRSVEIIDQLSFYFCENLKNIGLYDTNISFIGESAFSGTSISKVQFPPTIEFISNSSFEETKMLKFVDFSSCSNVKDYCYNNSGYLNTFYLIKEDKKKYKKRMNQINNPNNFTEHSRTNDMSIIAPIPPPLIIRPSIGCVTPRNSYNYHQKHQNPLKQVAPSRKLLTQASPRITKCKTSDKPNLLRPKLDITCYVCESAFYRSNASIFNFDLKEYQWFNFFNKCNQVKEYSLNPNISFNLRKLSKERFYYFKHDDDHLIGNYYKVRQILWEERDAIELKSNHAKKLNPLCFMNTSNLISINFSDDIQIKNIPVCCFSFTLVETIRIPKSVRKICKGAFRYCNGLREVIFSPDIKLEEIESHAFFDCKNLNSISLPNTISVIPEFCFASSEISKIILPESIIKICSDAFNHCENLSSVVFNEGLKEIGCQSFLNCKSLIKIDLPISLTTILPHAFSGCFNLRDVNIKPESKLVFIKNGAFDFTSIKKLKLNSKIEEICNIKNMPKLEKISFHKGKLLHFKQSKDGIVYQLYPINKEDEFNDNSSSDKEEEEDFDDLNDLIHSLHRKYDNKFDHFYQQQKQIKRIIFIPKQITCLEYNDGINIFGNSKIKKYPRDYFVQLNQITQMKFSSKFVVFSDKIFNNFNTIQSIEFDENVNLFEINSSLFENCKNLQKIVIPNSCVQINNCAFSNCVNLKKVFFGKVNKSSVKKHSLKIIRRKAFYNCISLQNIILPPTVQRIESSAFMNCKSLKRLEFGTLYLNDENKAAIHFDKEYEKLEFVGNSSFKNCSSLSSFRLPQLCKDIQKEAFMNCTSLAKFSGINLRLKQIDSSAFFNCSSLNSFRISISNNEKEEGNKKISHFEIKRSCFMNCTSLKEIVIENKSRKIDTMNRDEICCKSQILVNAFANCTSLTKAKFFIGNLSQMNRNAFLNCSLLEKIEINSPFYQSIVNDDKMSFLGCQKELTLELFNKNKKVNSFKITVKKYKHSARRLFKNHLSFLNKDFLSWPVNEEVEGQNKVKLHSTVIDSFNSIKIHLHIRGKTLPIPVTPGPADYQRYYYSYYSYPYYYDNYYSYMKFHIREKLPVRTNDVVTEYNYTIPTPRPPLNI